MRLLITFCLIFLFASSSSNAQQMSADEIVNKSIKKHGGKKYHKASFEFDFRKYHYSAKRDKTNFLYSRQLLSDPSTVDFLENGTFRRVTNNQEVALTPKKKRAYSNSINSVNYFVFQPYFLNDDAVHKELAGMAIINGTKYYQIRVTFDAEGGGDDHDDIYMYWINVETFEMDYLAYSFHVNGGGVRFRASYNKRKIGGIVFQDYVNYKADRNVSLTDLPELYKNGKLVELSKIETENIRKT